MGFPAFDPQMLASLQNTLGPAGLLDKNQEEVQLLQAELARRTKEAAGAAATAGTAYSDAAAAPPPQLSPLEESLPQFAGNIAGILSGDKGYAERGAQKVEATRSGLIKARLDNLTALKSAWELKATAAEHAQNLEEAVASRTHVEKLHSIMDKLKREQDLEDSNTDNQRKVDAATTAFGRAKELENLRSGNTIKEQAAKPTADSGGYFDTLTRQTRSGVPWLDMTNVPTPKEKSAAMLYAKEHGLVAVDKNNADKLHTAEEVYQGFDDIDSIMSNFMDTSTGPRRLIHGAQNTLRGALQSDANISAFNNTRVLGIRALQALAAGAGSGFRLTQSEVELMSKNMPRVTDNITTARRKLSIERRFLQNKENSYFGKPSEPLPKNDAGWQKWMDDMAADEAGAAAPVDPGAEKYRRKP